MKHSSKRNPCPICGRQKSSHCRFDDGRVYCYHGVSHGPPSDIKIGDVVTGSDGIEWAFVADKKGFAGNSALFTIHKPRAGWLRPARTLEKKRQQCAEGLEQLEAVREELRRAHDLASHAMAAPDYYCLTPDEIRVWLDVIQRAHRAVIAVKPRVIAVRSMDPMLIKLLSSLEEQLKALSYQQADFEYFWHNVLCDPSGGKGELLTAEIINGDDQHAQTEEKPYQF